MTEVLSITQPEASHFGSPLRRSSSQTSFLLQNGPSYSRSSQNIKSRYAAVGYDTSRLPASLPSSAPSSPRLFAPEFSNQPSYTSTPSSSLSLDEQCEAEEDVIFPTYDNGRCLDEIVEPPSSPLSPEPEVVTHSVSDTCLSEVGHGGTVKSHPTAGDDTDIEAEPTRHVDYLSHNWKEEEIWSSWRHIVSKRNVMKDHDVTWLYGPLQTGRRRPIHMDPTPPASQASRSNSFSSKKPILKKRTLSEIMLQKSLSASTLLKQAIDALHAQPPEQRRPSSDDRTVSDYATSSDFSASVTRSTTNPSTNDSASSSGIQTPCTKRHIHFNNKVEQCIAIDKGGNDRPQHFSAIRDDEDLSGDDMLTMKPVKHATKARINSKHSTPRPSFSSDSKTIAMLPSTTLNCRGDTPEPGQKQSKQRSWSGGSKLSPSPSQQTLRPSSSSTNFLLDDEDEDADMDWQPPSPGGRRNSLFPRGGLRMNASDEEDRERSGLRRTPSGMFMPYEDEDDPSNAGILGKVIDTVNTAKDIAHVIWNVGWHR